jgi:hypothetical protein
MQCRTDSTKTLFVFKEQRSSLTLENKDKVIATVPEAPFLPQKYNNISALFAPITIAN